MESGIIILPQLKLWAKKNYTEKMGLAETGEIIGNSLSFGFAQDKINIGLFGFGCVGQGLYDVLNYSQGLSAGIGKICVKDREKKRTLGNDYFTYERNDVLENENHNLVVELINDADAALEIISTALRSGKNVVTANKKTVAENFEYLYRLQKETGSSLLYEGACGGSIPILRTLEEYYDNEMLKSIRGILNGSSNFILTKMEIENCSFHEAVKQAQELGFAEKEPWLDVAGYDTKYKLCLLAAHGFGLVLKPENILNSGIQNISEFDINYAKEKNLRIKLIANLESSVSSESSGSLYNGRKEKKYRVYVLPKFIPRDEQLANVNYEYNGIEVEGVFSDRQFFYGKGAGSHPTGSAVLSDISAITYDYKYGYKKLKKRINGKPLTNGYQYFKDDNKLIDDEFSIKVYIRTRHGIGPGKLEIDNVEEEYKSSAYHYIIANVKFSSLRRIADLREVFIAIL